VSLDDVSHPAFGVACTRGDRHSEAKAAGDVRFT